MVMIKYPTNIFYQVIFPEFEAKMSHFDFGARKALMTSGYFGEVKQKL